VQEYMDELLGRNSPIVEIPQAYHHVPLDQPLALIAALRAILADWAHSVPKRAPAGGDGAVATRGGASRAAHAAAGPAGQTEPAS
jgi:hypothetical protein